VITSIHFFGVGGGGGSNQKLKNNELKQKNMYHRRYIILE
jgi:hypothetical protein